ncbi:TetR/AcrR family transcriptional regulator [Herbaspirillum sp. RTI4]|uniref:TetR/AcrR family transcriptional regulator n=1 Tax=Herbaspirillum sp. RTI4 TaxID=3048640 RepID=UPI002AB4D033|nr:TetR/AcrR family transcriptional regulator [Herbaspirillum sp. RTI4]MDY7576825.1 TetR/AcrR family transcriptional regulator [Herbaspirillum sp. RTI4]MEA9981421.1 TetR/AcrR family transcriptional regulator [Herbaspirillum sp. RTI4]
MAKLISFQERRGTLTPRSQKRVEAVLSTARTVFSENGYEKSTTLDIAQRLGISEATVFTYFGSKRELCMQVISDWYAELSEELEREVPLIQGTRPQLGYLINKHLNLLIRDGKGMCALVLSEGRSPDTGFAELIADLKRRYTAPLMNVLALAQEAKEIRPDMSLRLLRDMVYGSMEHILWDCIVTGNDPDLDHTAKQVTDLIWCAFAPPDVEINTLRRFHDEVTEAVRRAEVVTLPLMAMASKKRIKTCP